MKKTAIKKLALTMAVTIGMGALFSGCGIVSVNPERDSAQVMMTIDGEEVTKSEYNNSMAFTEMYYAASEMGMPTGSQLKEIQKGIFDGVVQNQVLAAKAKKDGKTVDEEAEKKNGRKEYESIKEKAGKKYDGILEKNYTNDESFAAYMENNAVTTAYAEKALNDYMDNLEDNPDDYLGKSVGTIGDQDVSRGEYTYYLIGESLKAYYSTGAALPNDDVSMKKTNETIFETIGTGREMIKYCEDNEIEITDDAIKDATASLDSMNSMFFKEDSELESFLKNYQLSLKQYKDYQKEQAKANAAETLIRDKKTEDIKVSDADAKKYYDKNKAQYDTSTVSACHILTEDKTLASQIYDAAKDCTTKADFEKVMDQFKSNSGVKEATDLGSFGQGQMVKEFSEKAFSMEVNTVSQPVKTEFGYHVIYVYDKTEGEAPSFEDNKEDILQTVKDEKGSEEFDKFKTKTTEGLKVKVGEIKSPAEEYVEELKTELKVTVNEKVVK